MIVSTSHHSSGEDFKEGMDPKKMRQSMMAMMGPGMADTMVRQAVQHVWMLLPEDKKTVAELKAQIQRLVDRVIENMKEDAAAFGQEAPG